MLRPSQFFATLTKPQKNHLTSSHYLIIISKVINAATMHFSIPLIALIGLTFVAAKPQAPTNECLQKCNDAFVECDDTAGAESGFYEFGEEITWWVPVIFAV